MPAFDQVSSLQVNTVSLQLQSTATQKVVVEHETDWTSNAPMTDDFDHLSPFHVSAFPSQSTAMQNLVVGHEIAVRLSLSMTDGFDHLTPFHVSAFPFQSTATHARAEGQETEAR